MRIIVVSDNRQRHSLENFVDWSRAQK